MRNRFIARVAGQLKLKAAWPLPLIAAAGFAAAGCSHLPGKPGFRAETMRPDQALGFAILYKTNCAGCHGDKGLNGPALPLDNPVYLAWAGRDRIIAIVSNGTPNGAMPPFGANAGGFLTGEQIRSIVDGMAEHWGRSDALAGPPPPTYPATSQGDTTAGLAAFATYCARCHGSSGTGSGTSGAPEQVRGSIVDPTYLALISRQGLRDIVVSGVPGAGMPDWRTDQQGMPMSDQNVTDIMAWMESHTAKFPGAPFPEQP